MLVTSSIIFYKKNFDDSKNNVIKKHYKIILVSEKSVKIFKEYIKKYKEMFDIPSTIVVNNDESIIPDFDIIVNFIDTNLGIKGYYLAPQK